MTLFPFRFVFLFFFIIQSAIAQQYLWPTDASRVMTSSFCEFRPGHFHAGLDFKTWGREGYPVFAVEDGYIMRVGVSPNGYGKVLYLKLTDGRTVVYGHLQKFIPEIEKKVAARQDAGKQYAVNFWLSPSDIPVTRGRIIGYSGSTGIGVPHLHFEVRDSRNRPINPLILGYPIEDTIAPVPVAVAATPFTSQSHVQGDVLPCKLPMRAVNRNTYVLPDTLNAWGTVGLAVDSYDQASGATNTFAPYRIQLILNGQPVFSAQYDGFDYSETDQIYLDRDYRLMQWGWGRFQNLYLSLGNTLNFYWPKREAAGLLKVREENSFSDDFCALASGIYPFQIILTDFFGNSTTIHGMLKWMPDTSLYTDFSTGQLANDPALDLQFLENQVRIGVEWPSPLATPRSVDIDIDDKLFQTLELKQIDPAGWMAGFPLDIGITGPHRFTFSVRDEAGQLLFSKEESFTLCHPSIRQEASSPSGECRVVVHRSGIRAPIWVQVKEERLPDPARKNPIVFRILPDDVLLDTAIDVMVERADSISEKYGLYQVSRKGKFNWVNHEVIPGWFKAKMRHIAPVTVLADTVPPVIQSVFPHDGMRLQTHWPEIRAVFRDTLSGIYGESNYRFILDGQSLLVAYDPEKQLGEGILRHSLATGSHTLEIIIRDRAKNVVKTKRTFYIE